MAAIDDLIRACVCGDIDLAFALLAADPELAHGANMFGATPLHAAHFSGHSIIAEQLRAGAVPSDGFTFAELGMIAELRAILDRDPSFAQAWSAGGTTALHGACYWGSVEAARLLLDRGADVQAITRDNFLHIHPLGSAVATPDIPNPAQSEDNVLRMVDLLLDRGADVNARRGDGMTALHTAAYRGHLRVIARLVECGADPAIRSNAGGNHGGETPLATASAQNQTEAAALLRRLAR